MVDEEEEGTLLCDSPVSAGVGSFLEGLGVPLSSLRNISTGLWGPFHWSAWQGCPSDACAKGSCSPGAAGSGADFLSLLHSYGVAVLPAEVIGWESRWETTKMFRAN